MVLAGGIGLIILIASIAWLKNNYYGKNVLFQADQSTKQADPKQLRVQFYKASIKKIVTHPLGNGPGTAGLASIHNKVQGTTLNENYYLQIASETGILGIILFIAILAVTTQRLLKQRGNTIAIALLASFAGLAFTNLLVHIWSGEAVAYTWWGLSGIVLAPMPKNPKAFKG